MDDINKRIVVCGIIGAIGAFLTIIADIAYNIGGGNQLGLTLFIAFLGLFSFPLWWGGIWVIYLGLKPAGRMWSLFPCILFSFYVSTVNVFYHSCYPFWTALKENQRAATGNSLALIEKIILEIKPYTNIIENIDNVIQITICIWIAIAILKGRTYFSKWIVLLIPICPTIAAILINQICQGFLHTVGPYLACVPMLILFIVTTITVHKKYSDTAS